MSLLCRTTALPRAVPFGVHAPAARILGSRILGNHRLLGGRRNISVGRDGSHFNTVVLMVPQAEGTLKVSRL